MKAELVNAVQVHFHWQLFVRFSFSTLQAALKHINNTTTGLIFGIFELVLFIMSPVFGNFVSILLYILLP